MCIWQKRLFTNNWHLYVYNTHDSTCPSVNSLSVKLYTPHLFICISCAPGHNLNTLSITHLLYIWCVQLRSLRKEIEGRMRTSVECGKTIGSEVYTIIRSLTKNKPLECRTIGALWSECMNQAIQCLLNSVYVVLYYIIYQGFVLLCIRNPVWEVFIKNCFIMSVIHHMNTECLLSAQCNLSLAACRCMQCLFTCSQACHVHSCLCKISLYNIEIWD